MVAQVLTQSNGLSEAVDSLVSEPIDGLPDSALGGDLVDIRRQIDRLEGEFLRRLHRFDRSHGALADGAVSTVSWLRATCGVTGTVAAHRVRMARLLAELPAATQSLCAGRAPFTNVALIAQLADDVGTENARTVEDTLVTAAELLDPARMRYLTLVTRTRLDAQGALEQDNRNHDRRWFACDQTYGGVFIVRGELDAEGGAILKTAIDGLCAPAGPEDSRTGSQRRADALVDLASRQLQRGGAGSVHGSRPHLTLTTSVAALQGQPGVEPAELSGVGPVHAETARRIACDAVCTVVTVAPAAQASAIGVPAAEVTPLSVGRATRTIPPHLRTALRVRDRGCRFPGCDRPPEWTDGHHIRHWVDHGPTEIPNVVLLCRRHHRFVHEKGWQVRIDEQGAPVITPPP
jgi:Domain of unknown function (DUF222)/HNH endonuclease